MSALQACKLGEWKNSCSYLGKIFHNPMLESLFPSLSEKEAAFWFCCAVLWFIWVFSRFLKSYFTSPNLMDTSDFELQVSKTVFVHEVICWCVKNLGLPPRSKALPNVVLRYYRHQKLMGTYLHRGKVITLYWGSHSTIIEVINTLIHEYQHFLDIRKDQDSREYDKETALLGYYRNPFERRARQVANRSEKLCLRFMIKKGLLK